MKKTIRWPLLCTRCGSLSHYSEDCKVPTLGMCAAERAMVDQARRGRNIALALIAIMMAGYMALVLIGGPA